MSRATGRLLTGGLAPGKGYTALLRYMAFGAVVTATLRYNTKVWAMHKTRYEEMVVVWSALVKTVLGIHAYAQVKLLIIAGIHGTIPVNIQIEKQLLQYWSGLTQTPADHRGRLILQGVWRNAVEESWAANVQIVCTKLRIDITEENLTGMRRNEWWTVLREKAQVQAIAEIH